MKSYNQTTYTPESELRCLGYISEYGGSPKPGVFHSVPSEGGQYINMYGLPSSRKYLIETEEGYLMGICDETDKLCKFNVIDDTYIVQIPSIIKLKTEIDKLPKDKIDPNFKVKSRFR